MSTKYKNSRDVPLDIIITRLNELSDAVAGGRESQEREFTMRIPAECDRDADLVIDEAARRLTTAQSEMEALRGRVAELEEAASWCEAENGDMQSLMALTRVVERGNSRPWLLRKQAEAVEETQRLISQAEDIIGMRRAAREYSESLRQQADEADRAGGEK